MGCSKYEAIGYKIHSPRKGAFIMIFLLLLLLLLLFLLFLLTFYPHTSVLSFSFYIYCLSKTFRLATGMIFFFHAFPERNEWQIPLKKKIVTNSCF